MKQPALFIGHGNPMNAILNTPISRGWVDWKDSVYKSRNLPKAIVVVSAHWLTQGTKVTFANPPETIHDFGGFPQELFDVEYKAPGDPKLAQTIIESTQFTETHADHEWGLDHGTWCFLKWMFPEANIPILQISIDTTKPFYWHYELARDLSKLREQGVLLVGSGNLVHNLRLYNWKNPEEKLDWAEESNENFKKLIIQRDAKELSKAHAISHSAELAINSAEHYIPALYGLGFGADEERMEFFNDSLESAISMTSFWME